MLALLWKENSAGKPPQPLSLKAPAVQGNGFPSQ